jgi:hypothetical protein
MKSSTNLNAFIHFLTVSEKVEESFCLHALIKDDRGLHQIPSEGGLRPPFIHWLPVGFLTTFHFSFSSVSVA